MVIHSTIIIAFPKLRNHRHKSLRTGTNSLAETPYNLWRQQSSTTKTHGGSSNFFLGGNVGPDPSQGGPIISFPYPHLSRFYSANCWFTGGASLKCREP